MKIISLTIICMFVYVSSCFATATSETGDNRAKPILIYGKTAAGVVTALKVNTSGAVPITTQ